MTVANNALIYNLALIGTPIFDNLAAGPASAQGTATRMLGEMNRVTTSVSNGSCILGSSNTGDAASMTFVVNDSPNAILVYPFTGEFNNGTVNATLSIPAGQCGFFIRVTNDIAVKNATSPGWRSNVVA